MNKSKAIQYVPDSTVLSSLNPLTNSILLVTIAITTLISPELIPQFVILVILSVLFSLSEIRVLQLQGSKFLLFTSVFIGVVQILFFRQGEILFSIAGLPIYTAAVNRAAIYSARFTSIILESYLFVFSTDPNALVYMLMRIGLPYRFGFAMVNAIRMLPISRNEIQRIHIAQVSRGARYRFFPVRLFAGQVSRFLQVLIVSLIKRVDALVYSLEGRSFGIYKKRTFLSKSHIRSVDWIVIITTVTLFIMNICVKNL